MVIVPKIVDFGNKIALVRHLLQQICTKAAVIGAKIKIRVFKARFFS